MFLHEGSVASRGGGTSRRSLPPRPAWARSSTAVSATARAIRCRFRGRSRTCRTRRVSPSPTCSTRRASGRASSSGHSDGGSIAIVFAGSGLPQTSRVRGLVLEAPHVFVEDLTVRSIAAARESYQAGPLRERLARHHRTNVDALALRGWNDAWLDPGFRAWNIEEHLPRVRIPSLVIQGEDDAYGTLAQVDAIERGAAGPVTLLVLPGVRAHAAPGSTGGRPSSALRSFLGIKAALAMSRSPRYVLALLAGTMLGPRLAPHRRVPRAVARARRLRVDPRDADRPHEAGLGVGRDARLGVRRRRELPSSFGSSPPSWSASRPCPASPPRFFFVLLLFFEGLALDGRRRRVRRPS